MLCLQEGVPRGAIIFFLYVKCPLTPVPPPPHSRTCSAASDSSYITFIGLASPDKLDHCPPPPPRISLRIPTRSHSLTLSRSRKARNSLLIVYLVMFWDENKPPSVMVYISFYLLVSCYILAYIGCMRSYSAVFGRIRLCSVVVGRHTECEWHE